MQGSLDRISGDAPPVGIVVLNYENAEDTAECVASLTAVRYGPLEVAVVDNASSAECYRQLQALQAATPGLLLARSERNGGYAAGNNVGIRLLLDRGAEFVLVLNNDALAPPDELVAPLVSAMVADPSIAIAVPRILSPAGREEMPPMTRPTYGSYYRRFGVLARLRGPGEASRAASPWTEGGDPVAVDLPSGACMMLRASFLRDIGLLDEGTFLYQEEAILGEQVRQRGLRVAVVPRARVTHLRGRTTSRYRMRRLLAMWRSQNYYLREYRGVDPVRRGLLLAYQAGSFGALQAASSTVRALRRVVRRG